MTAIKSGAFSGCGSLSDINIPDSVTFLGSGAFADDAPISVTEYGVTYVDNWVVGYDDQTTVAVLREGTVEIAAQAFMDNSFSGFGGSLKKITILDSVKIIGENAFYKNGLKTVDFKGNKAQWKTIEKANFGTGDMYGDNAEDCTVHCIDGDVVYGRGED